MRNHLIIGVIFALILGGAVGFIGGMQYQKSQRTNFMTFTAGDAENGQTVQKGESGQNRGFGQGASGSTAMIGRPVTGEVISSDENSVTVKLTDGSSKIVLVNDETTINKQSEGTLEDLKTGETIAAFGETNSDGSITAVSVQLNPQMRIMTKPTGEPDQE